MKIKPKKSINEMAAPSDGYTLTPAERAPIDKAIADVAALEQQAKGMLQMIISTHGLTGNWDFNRVEGRLFRVPETK